MLNGWKESSKKDVQANAERRCGGQDASKSSAWLSGLSLTCPLLSHCLSSSSRELGARGSSHMPFCQRPFTWLLPTRISLSLLPSLGEKDSDQTLFSFPVCPQICLCANACYPETIKTVSMSVRTPRGRVLLWSKSCWISASAGPRWRDCRPQPLGPPSCRL